jgi:two-component system, OmpR family, sensor histidine kinase CiaH
VFNRIRAQLVAWNLLVLGLILLVVGGAAYVVLSRSLTARVDQTLDRQSAELVREMERAPRSPGLRVEREGYRGGSFTLALSEDGRILANPQGVNLPLATLPHPTGDAARIASVTVDGAPVRVAVRRVDDGGSAPTLLVVGQSMASEQETLDQLLFVAFTGGLFGLILSLIGAWFLAGRALIPIQRAFDRQREFVADASHELRTPLTVLRAATDLLGQHRTEPLDANGELFDDLRQEIGRLERLAGDLLTLARSDLGELGLAVGEIALGPFVGDVARLVLPLARQRQVAVECLTDETVQVEADPDRLQQVLLALLDNALKHSHAGGRVRVAVRRQGMTAAIEVADEGEGISAEHVPHLFERFYRVERSRSRQEGGAGLGLAIARTLVEAHGGRIALSSKVGVGTIVTIWLPLPDPVAPLTGRLGQLAARLVDHAPARDPDYSRGSR